MRADLAGSSFLTARAIGTAFLQSPQMFEDATNQYDQTDLYHLNLTSARQISLQLRSQMGDSDLQVLDRNGHELYGSYQAGATEESLTVDLAAGEYYVYVAHFHGESDYSLQISTPSSEILVQPPMMTDAESAGPERTGSEAAFVPEDAASNVPTSTAWLATARPRLDTARRSGQQEIDALINSYNYYWNTSSSNGVIPYSFYRARAGTYYGSENVAEVNDAIKASVREILAYLETVINVRFVEVEEMTGQYGVIRYMFSDGNGDRDFYAYSYYPGFTDIASDVHLNPLWDARDHGTFSGGPGTNGYTSLIHETLHALGLKHPGNYDAIGDAGDGPFLDPSQDNKSYTVMSYNQPGALAISPLTYDIRALQYLYGARTNAVGDSVYRFTAPMHLINGDRQYGHPTRAINHAIWDAGGLDTIDLSGGGAYNYHVDLRDGGLVTAQIALTAGQYVDRTTRQEFVVPQYGTWFAFSSVIENVKSSQGSDWIIANDAPNIFSGYDTANFGHDVLESTNALDILDLSGNQRTRLSLSNQAGNLVIDWGTGNSIQLKDYFTHASLKILIEGQYYIVTAVGAWEALTLGPISAEPI
jgi:hypothetical protein